MGKKRGPEDHRTEGQRFHDALQEACELLIRARMVPDRAGADTQVIAHIPLSELRGRDGASALEAAWIAGRLGGPGYLTGKDAEAAACDALIVPVVTGHPDMTVIDQIIELALTAAGHGTGERGGTAGRRARRGQGAAAGGVGGAAVRDRPAGHRLRLRPARHRRAAAHPAAGAPVQHRQPAAGHRVLRQRPGAHPPRGRAARPGVRLAALPPPRQRVRRAPPRAQEGRRQDRRQLLRSLVPVPPRHLYPPVGLAAHPAPGRHHRGPRPRRADPPQPLTTHTPRRVNPAPETLSGGCRACAPACRR